MRAAGLQPTGGSRVWIAGIDGCRGGWFALLLKRALVSPFVADLRFVLCPTFSELLNRRSSHSSPWPGSRCATKRKPLPIGASGQP